MLGASDGQPAVLVASTEHLVQALETIEAAARDFGGPDPAARRRGEATFLNLRDSDAALEYACYALQHSGDSFVLFQMLGLILQQLPTIPSGDHASQHVSSAIPSLQHLRDFLLHLVVVRGEAAELSELHQSNVSQAARPWPPYVRSRAFQLIAAATKRMLGTALSGQPEYVYPQVVHSQLGPLKTHILSLLFLPDSWPTGHAQQDASTYARTTTALGIVRALLDEFVLTPAGAGADDLMGLSGSRAGLDGLADSAGGRRSSSTSKAKQKDRGASVGLTAREHLLCKVALQIDVLPDLLQCVLHMLVKEVQRPVDQQQHVYPYLHFYQLIATLEKLLSWSFVLTPPSEDRQASLAAMATNLNAHGDDSSGLEHDNAEGASSQSARLIPSPMSSVMLSQDLLRLLSAAYDATQTSRSADAVSAAVAQVSGTNSRACVDAGREASTALHRLRTCMLTASRFGSSSTLAGTNGQRGSTSQDEDELERQHTAGILELLAHLASSLGAGRSAASKSALERMHLGQNLLFAVQLFGNFAALMSARPDKLTTAVGLAGPTYDGPVPEALARLLDMLSRLTMMVFEFAFQPPLKSSDFDEDELTALADAALDQVICGWSILAKALLSAIPEGHSPALNACTAAVREVAVRYVQGRIAAAGLDSQAGGDGEDDDDVDVESEIGSAVEKDRDRYADQLRTFAELARLHTSVLQAVLVEMNATADKIGAVLVGAVQSGASRPADARSMRVLEARWEETHVLLLIAGYLLCDDIEGEVPAIPRAVEALDAGQGSGDAGANPAVALIRQMSLTLFDTLSSPSAIANELSSPQVMETSLWFINRWTASYLLPLSDERGEGQPSESIGITSALSGPSRTQIISFLAQKTAEGIKLWLAEADVLGQLAAFIGGFCRCPHAAAQLVALPAFEDVVGAVLSSLDSLPVDTHGSFISAIVGTTHTASRWARSASKNGAPVEQIKYINERTAAYTTTITQALEDKLSSAVLRPDFVAVAQSPAIIQAVQTALDMLEGLALTIQLSPAAGIYNFIARFFPTLIQIVDVYSERSEITVLVLKVFRTLAVSTAWAISEDDGAQKQLNEAVWALFAAIQRKRNIIGSGELGVADDEDPYEALCLALETLHGVLELTDTGDITDASASNADRLFGPLSALRAEDVGMYGFSVLFASLTPDAFSEPRVRDKLCKVTCTIWRFFAGRVFAVARAETKPGGLAGGLVHVLAKLLAADDSQHSWEALDPIRPLAKAVQRIAKDERAKDLRESILPTALDELLAVLLRLVLLEPSEELDAQIIALRPLLLARAAPQLGGEARLAAVLQRFCAEVPLYSQRERAAAAGRADLIGGGHFDGLPALPAAEETRRRELVGATVSSIVQACFSPSTTTSSSGAPVGLDERPPPRNIREAMQHTVEERKVEAHFCEAVKRAGLLRARRALRIR